MSDIIAGYIYQYPDVLPKKESKFKKPIRKVLSAVFKVGDKTWKNIDDNHEKAFATRHEKAEKIAKAIPEKRDEILGLDEVFVALYIMDMAVEKVHPKAAVSFMKTFEGIFTENPKISDIDALILFVKKEKVVGNKKRLPLFDGIPEDVKNSIDLGIKKIVIKNQEVG